MSIESGFLRYNFYALPCRDWLLPVSIIIVFYAFIHLLASAALESWPNAKHGGTFLLLGLLLLFLHRTRRHSFVVKELSFAFHEAITVNIAQQTLGRLAREAKQAFEDQEKYRSLEQSFDMLSTEAKKAKEKFWRFQNFVAKTAHGIQLPEKISDYYDW